MHQPHIFSPCTSPKCPTAPGALTPKPEAITRALISSFSRARVRAPGKAARLAGTGQVGFPTGTLWSRTSQLPPGRTWRPPGKGSGKCLLGVKTKRKGARRGRRALSVTLVRKFQCNQSYPICSLNWKKQWTRERDERDWNFMRWNMMEST